MPHPRGRLVVLEAKLWRNPEARRKVIGQILDYAKELSHWTYETLDAAVRAARRRDQGAARSLFDVVSEQHSGLDEAQFIDTVSRSLLRGELLLLIAGDGIRENVGAITNFIEDHGTFHFTFGLVEMAIYRMPDGAHLGEPDSESEDEELDAIPRPDHPVEWKSDDKWHTIHIWRKFGDQMLTSHRAEVQAWLGDVVNRFINAFRPAARG